MTINTTTQRRPSAGRARLPILIAALLLVASMTFIGSALTGTAQAQGASGAIPSINLTSDTPGEIEVSWTAPSLAPSDYRLSWTPDGEAYPSYKDANQADRGNTYPKGDQTSLTLTGLTAGAEYKVQVRARYNDGEHAGQPWAGPWREAAVTVAGGEEPAPTPVPDPTHTPVPDPTATPTPAPDDQDVIQGLSLASSEPGQLVVTWEIPETTPTDYRISWARSSLNFPSYKDTNGPEKGTLYPLGSETTLTLDNLTPGVDYKIHMRARYYNEDRSEHLSSGPWTDAVTQRVKDHPPAAPTGLTAARVGHNSLTLTWNDPQDESITGYRIMRGASANSLSTIEEDAEETSREYQDETVSPETTYHYAVLALSQDGNSVQSGAISATTPAAPSSGEQNEPREAPKKKDPPQRVGPRQAVTTDVWTATLTPGDFGSGNLGCNNASPTNKCSTAAVLSDDDFTYDSTSYSFTTLNLNATSFSLTVDADITAATTNDLTIVVGSTSLAFAEAPTQTARTKTWFNPGFSWTAGTDVSIRIIDLAPPSLTSAVVLADGNTIQLAFSEDLQSANLPPAAAFTVTAGGSAVTVTGVAAESTADVLQITISPPIGQGQTVVVAYEDPTAVDDANAIQDAAGNDTPDFTTGSGSVPAVTNNSALTNEVLASWSLTPAGLAVGDQFRLIFLSSTKRNALSTDIAEYNTFVQDRAAAGHADIQAYSGGFGVIGCTAAVDARDNTSTTGTGVPIYWLDGTKVADDYADFYDGSWADEVNDKDESGADAHDTSQSDNYPFTGCQNDGTEEFAGATNPRGLGATTGFVRTGRLNSSGTLQDPIDGNDVADTDATRPMYGLSAVFEVSSSPSTNPNAPAAVSDVAVVPVRRTSDSLTVSWSTPDNTGKPALNGYDVRYGQDEDNWTTVRQNDAASTTLIITGLRPNNYYDVQVRALSAEYSGPWSSNAEGATISPAETVLANHPLVPDDLGPGDSFRLLYITEDTTAATGTGIHAYHTIAFDGVVSIGGRGNLMQDWPEVIFGQIALLSTPGADARLITDTTWDETDPGVPIYWVNGARVADDYADFYDGTWADEANPTSGLGQPHSLADPVPWTGTDHDGTELIDGTASRAVGQSTVGVGAPGSTASGAGPLNGDAAFASTQERPLYGLWHVMVVDENLRLVTNIYQPAVGNVGNIRAAVRAQLFTTGPHSSGYGISSIEVEKGSETATFLGTVAIHTTDGDGDPDLADGLHATLSLENTGSSSWTLAAPAGTVLKPSTTYALVFKGDAGTYPDLYTTPADGEDSPADGWSLADTLVYDSGSGWVDNTVGRSLVIEMIGPLAAAVANNAPTVENEIPDQTAAAGTPFTYTFPTNTFHDADGDTLTYTAIQDDSDAILPTWITFDASTQTFSGTPAVADIKSLFIKVTATDGTASVSDTFIIRVVAAPTSVTMTDVLSTWSLRPAAMNVGDQFRLLFLSSTQRDAQSATISDYNSFIQTRVVAGHADIQTHTIGFRAVGCTETIDARDNTFTTGTGVPIYWLNGAKVADDYADFYDGSWNDEVNDKSEFGFNGPDTSSAANYPWTGCINDGTEATSSVSISEGLGRPQGVRVGRPNSSNSNHGPLSSDATVAYTADRPMYGISGIFRVVADTESPTLVSAEVPSTGAGSAIYLVFSEDVDKFKWPPAAAVTITADGIPVTATGISPVLRRDHYADVTPRPHIRQGQDVVVTYTDPTGGNDANAFQDLAGNDVATFTTGQNRVVPVTNNSALAPVAPGAPTSLTATARESTQIDLSWTAPTDNGGRVITGYKIEVSSDSGNNWTDRVATTGDNNTTYAHTGLAISTTRHYRVSAINSIGTSSASNVDSATTVYRDVKVQFGANLYRVTEGRTVNVNVRLDVDPERTVSIPITKQHLFGASDSDYSGVPATVTFNAGETSKDIPFMAVDDDVDDDNESVALAISETLPSKVTRGSRFTLRVEIEDNDEMGTMGTNAPPTATNGDVTVDEDKIFNFWFRPSILGYSDTDGNSMASFTITEIPDRGALTMSGWPINNLPFRIHSKSVDNQGRSLWYKPAPNGHGTPYATFKFKVNDGTVDSTAEYTMTINITPVNDPAYGRVFITGPTQVGYTLKAFTSSIGDRDGIPRDQLNYQWKRYAADGTTFEANIGANSNTYTLTNSEQGKKIKLEVRFTDNDGTDEGPLTSPAFPYITTQTIGEATLISTIGLAGDLARTFTTQDQGQVFTTGTNPNGYTVTSVVIISEDHGQDDVALKICGVDGNLHPTAACTDLTAPGLFQPGPLVFTAPSGTTLTGGRTNYMVVFNSPGGQEVLLGAHVSDGYDSNSLAGFSIRNRIHYKNGSNWEELSYRRGLRIAVLGTINP